MHRLNPWRKNYAGGEIKNCFLLGELVQEEFATMNHREKGGYSVLERDIFTRKSTLFQILTNLPEYHKCKN